MLSADHFRGEIDEQRWPSASSKCNFILQRCSQLMYTKNKQGVERGPIRLVEERTDGSGLINKLRNLGWDVTFNGHQDFVRMSTTDDPAIGIVQRPRQVSRAAQAVAETVASFAKQEQLPLTLGGDHSLVRVMAVGEGAEV